MTQSRDHYQMLGVPQDATSEEIKRVYRVLARQHHPDTQSESDGTSSLFRGVQEAYEILIDEQRRKAYDQQLSESGMHGQSLFSLSSHCKTRLAARLGLKNRRIGFVWQFYFFEAIQGHMRPPRIA